MKVYDLNGNISNWKITGNRIVAEDNRKRSNLHLQARTLLYSIFPTSPIIEEVACQINGRAQFFDFVICNPILVIEIHGEQHYKFNSLFHSSARDFIDQKKRDRDKKEWCRINNITYVELPYNESVEEWKNRLMNR